MLDSNIIFSLQEFNEQLKNAEHNFFDSNSVREGLKTKGKFKNAIRLSPSQIIQQTNKRVIGAVDGSRVEYGSFYPYHLALLRTLANTTKNQMFRESKIISPLTPDINDLVEDLAKNNSIPNDEAFRLLIKNILIQMELEAAINIVKAYKPYLLMLDGGFLLFDKFPEWEILVEECLRHGVILVGIIEEIATAEIAPLIGLEAINRPRVYDREILFGLFEQGEYIEFLPEYKLKKDYATIFARLSTSPQAIACDFLGQQATLITDATNLIATLTPTTGQGIPAWLQIIDRQVRISKRDMDKLLYTCLDTDIIEKYFIPNRMRRIY